MEGGVREGIWEALISQCLHLQGIHTPTPPASGPGRSAVWRGSKDSVMGQKRAAGGGNCRFVLFLDRASN